MHNFTHGVMFHHFHDELNHSEGQGSISALDFSRILEYVITKYNLLDPDTYEDKMINGKLADNDVVLTFDDALKSQYEIAFPILEQEGIKAYFFVYTNAFSVNPDPLEFYRDYRNTAFQSLGDFYEQFFSLFAELLPDLFSKYKSSYPEDYLALFPFYTEMDRRFRYVRDEILGQERYFLVMDRLMAGSSYDKSERQKILFMNEGDLVSLSKSGHSIGLHSSSHPTRIDYKSYDEQLIEYTQNFEFISRLTGKSPTSMSHPCGRYNSDTLQILSNIGMKIGFCSSIYESASKGCFELPREDHANLLKFINS